MRGTQWAGGVNAKRIEFGTRGTTIGLRLKQHGRGGNMPLPLWRLTLEPKPRLIFFKNNENRRC